ncbi:asparagine--tRNA ligase [Ranunculus cassubicifolius]
MEWGERLSAIFLYIPAIVKVAGVFFLFKAHYHQSCRSCSNIQDYHHCWHPNNICFGRKRKPIISFGRARSSPPTKISTFDDRRTWASELDSANSQRFFPSSSIKFRSVITGVDAKGHTEKFQVITTLSGKEDRKQERNEKVDTKASATKLEILKSSIKEKSNKIEELKRSESNKEALMVALQDLQKANELALQLEALEKSNPEHRSKAKRESSSDFFPRHMYLTVSSQLHLESYACALGNVYSFGPTFQAQKSQSTRHLAELWMVELEIAFADLEDAMDCAEDYLKFLCKWILEHCSDDMKFVSKQVDQTIVDRIQSISSNSFQRITYKDALVVLSEAKDKTFEVKLDWGVALTEEHESYLAEEIYKKPVIIYNYPKELKPFYARVNDDGKTVSTIDVVVPKVGTLIRGCQKEERFDKLITRFKESNLPREQYEWYFDIRRHGSVQHAGFSLEFDRMVLFATGLSDIRDVSAFPKAAGIANH